MILLLSLTSSRAQQSKHLLWVQTLFFSLAILFWLLAGGVVNALLHKARGPLPLSRVYDFKGCVLASTVGFYYVHAFDWCCFFPCE